MKIFATGDTHGNLERFRPEYFPEGGELTKEDVVLQLGDFGGVWFGDERDDEALDWLEGLPFTLAFVSGNHENYDALVKYPIENWHGGRVQPIRPHVLHLMRGQVFELAGRTFFTMGGAASHDIEDGILSLDDPNFERKYLTLKQKEHTRFRIDHLSWWREELPSEEEYAEARRNLDAHGWAVGRRLLRRRTPPTSTGGRGRGTGSVGVAAADRPQRNGGLWQIFRRKGWVYFQGLVSALCQLAERRLRLR